MTKINIGIIGAGRISKLHAENLSMRIQEANPVIISDIFLEAAEKCAAEYTIPQAVKDYREILMSNI